LVDAEKLMLAERSISTLATLGMAGTSSPWMMRREE
jgi:hypothetical protein